MLLIYSGGMDSSVLLYQYQKEIKLAVTFDYGSKQNEREAISAKYNCAALGIEHRIIKLDFFANNFKSALLKGGEEIPSGEYADENLKSTVVPFRNGIMLSIAAGIAESNDIETILIANHFGDHTVYPDCRRSFIDPMAEAIKNGTYNNIKLFSPYCDITKQQIAQIGLKYNVPFEQTYSCYKGADKHCGECSTCCERKKALEGFDKTEYIK